MFEVTCPKCQTTSTAADFQGGEVIACSRCGQKLRVLVEAPAVAAPPVPGGLPAPPVADAAPPSSGGGLLLGLAGIGGLGVAAVILAAWFFMGQRSDEKTTAEGDKAVAVAPTPPEPAKDSGKPPESSPPSGMGGPGSQPGPIAGPGGGTETKPPENKPPPGGVPGRPNNPGPRGPQQPPGGGGAPGRPGGGPGIGGPPGRPGGGPGSGPIPQPPGAQTKTRLETLLDEVRRPMLGSPNLQQSRYRELSGRAPADLGLRKDDVAGLVKALDELEPPVRLFAAYALGTVGEEAVAAAGKLGAVAVKDREPLVRVEAVLALGKLGPGARVALPELAKVLEAKDETPKNVRVCVGLTFARLGDDDMKKAAIPGLLESFVVDGKDRADAQELLKRSSEALGRIGKSAADVFPEALAAKFNGSDAVSANARLAVYQTIAAFMGPEVYSTKLDSALINASRMERSPPVRQAALAARNKIKKS